MSVFQCSTFHLSLHVARPIFFDSPESYTNRDWGLAAPWGSSVSLTAPAGGFANPYQGYPGGNPFPTAYPPTRNSTFPLRSEERRVGKECRARSERCADKK